MCVCTDDRDRRGPPRGGAPPAQETFREASKGEATITAAAFQAGDYSGIA